MYKVFLDTNILLDYFAVRQPFYQAARNLMVAAYFGDVQLWISATQLTDVFYVLSGGGKPSEGAAAQEKLRKCRRFLNVCDFTTADIDSALDCSWQDFEDAGIYVCAQKIAAHLLITRDAKGFLASRLPVMDASQLMDKLRADDRLTYAELDI
jgi:predicted nucleic acid-binding protein